MMTAMTDVETIPAIQAEIEATFDAWRRWQADQAVDDERDATLTDPLYGMMRYHLGLVDASFQPAPADGGKKLRGQLCLLGCALVGGDPATALPLAAAVELLHNFTLVHDDIQDRSPLRRHRPTVWSLWGVGQAINVGDGLYALARLALMQLATRGVPAERVLALATLSEQTLLRILEGQFLDLGFEQDWSATPALYARMIRGKSASLVGFCLEAGGRVGGATPAEAALLRECGIAIGMEFQVRDDILGIWGDASVTGKPAAADLYARKKSLPLLIAMERATPADQDRLRQCYATDTLDAEKIAAVLDVLDRTDARPATQAVVERYRDEALSALQRLDRAGPERDALRGMIDRLAERAF